MWHPCFLDGIAAFDVAPDYESYNFRQLDWKNPADRKLTEDVWKWEGSMGSHEFADGKTYVLLYANPASSADYRFLVFTASNREGFIDYWKP